MNKFIRLTAVLLLLLMVVLSAGTGASAEDEGPSYESLVVSPTSIDLGGTVHFFLTQSPSAYFLTVANLEFYKPDGSRQTIELHQNGDRWDGYFTAMNAEEVGTWELVSVHLEDDGGYVSDIIPAPGDYYFTVQAGAGEDHLPPSVSSVEFASHSINAGETNRMRLLAEDDVTGVRYIYATLTSPSGKQVDVYGFQLTPEGYWEADFTVPAFAEGGTWKVRSIFIEDHAGNSQSYFYEETYPEHFSTFEVISEQQDINAPVVESISFEKETITAGESNAAYIKVTDDVSGTAYVEAMIGYDFDKLALFSACEETDEPGIFKCEFTTSPYAKSGEWKVLSVYTRDHADNMEYYEYNYIPAPEVYGSFVLENDNEDLTPPVFESLAFSKSVYQAGDEIQITINAKDDNSGVSYAGVYLLNETGDYMLFGDDLYQQEDGSWKGNIYVPDGAPHGTYSIGYIALNDFAGNFWVRHYGPDGIYEETDGGSVKVDAERYSITIGDAVSSPEPAATSITDINKKKIAGLAVPFAAVEVYANGELLASGTADDKGQFELKFDKQEKHAVLTVITTNPEDGTAHLTEMPIKIKK